MQFAIHYKGAEVTIDVTLWESTIDNRMEYYAVFINQQETFINFVKRTGQAIITETSASTDLTADIKAVIKEKLIAYIQQHNL